MTCPLGFSIRMDLGVGNKYLGVIITRVTVQSVYDCQKIGRLGAENCFKKNLSFLNKK